MLRPATLTVAHGRIGLQLGLLLISAVVLAALVGRATAQVAPLWVNDLAYGSAGGGFYWDPQSGQVWTGERGWHQFAPQPPRTVSPLWVNDLAYPSAGGGFYLDPLSKQVWTAECNWHYFNRGGCGFVPSKPGTPGQPAAGTIGVRNVTWYVSDVTGSIWVVGEVVNNRSQAAEYIEITARFYSAANALLATDFGFSDIDVVAPGADSPFSVLLIDPPPGIVSVSVEVTDFVSPPYGNDQPASGLTATVTNTYVNSIGTLHVVGTVTNSSSRTYEYVKPVVALYDSAGRVIRVDFTFTEPDTLAPGTSGTFDLLVIDAPSYSRLRIWVDGSD
jgi:hypothetical protein